jgi:hypothetical protein
MADASVTADARAARDRFAERISAPGHAVENVRTAVDDLDGAFAAGALHETPAIDRMLADLRVALEQDAGQKLGGKSAEAARFIARALLRELDRQLDAP